MHRHIYILHITYLYTDVFIYLFISQFIFLFILHQVRHIHLFMNYSKMKVFPVLTPFGETFDTHFTFVKKKPRGASILVVAGKRRVVCANPSRIGIPRGCANIALPRRAPQVNATEERL